MLTKAHFLFGVRKQQASTLLLELLLSHAYLMWSLCEGTLGSNRTQGIFSSWKMSVTYRRGWRKKIDAIVVAMVEWKSPVIQYLHHSLLEET